MRASFIMGTLTHVFYFYTIKHSILSQPVWSPCKKKWTSVILTLSFLSVPPSSSWGDRNGLQPWCIEFFFFPSSRSFSHARSHVDCVASSAWIKGTASAFPRPCRRGGHSHFMLTLMSACAHTRPRMTATTGVQQRHVARYSMNNCQRDEFLPTCAALRAVAITAVEVTCCNGHWYYRDTATLIMLSLVIVVWIRLSRQQMRCK